jgi:hypothetical protein
MQQYHIIMILMIVNFGVWRGIQLRTHTEGEILSSRTSSDASQGNTRRSMFFSFGFPRASQSHEQLLSRFFNSVPPYVRVIKVFLEPRVAASPGTGLKDRSDPPAAKYARVIDLNGKEEMGGGKENSLNKADYATFTRAGEPSIHPPPQVPTQGSVVGDKTDDLGRLETGGTMGRPDPPDWTRERTVSRVCRYLC